MDNKTVSKVRSKMHYDAKRRAKIKGIPFDIVRQEIIIPRFCPILGFELSVGDGSSHQQSPTLDRIDNALGYVSGNIWVISMLANTMKSFASVSDLRAFARWVSQKYGQYALPTI
jgi:hypothetical protein